MTKANEFIKGMKSGMKAFGQLIASIINSALLLIVYLIGVGITSIIAKLVGKRFLETKLSGKSSYWTPLNLKTRPLKGHYRQF
ncbi:MAG: hypothetical protein AAB855_00190 [Patescibacteria group bacterium]